MSGLVGQGYDGASVMSLSRNGVRAIVPEKYPNATYVHCRSHVLNLAIWSGCKSVRFIQNLFHNVSKLGFLVAALKGKKYFFRLPRPPMTASSSCMCWRRRRRWICQNIGRGKQATNCTEILCYSLECKSYYPLCSSCEIWLCASSSGWNFVIKQWRC